jgi:hypothetical protein
MDYDNPFYVKVPEPVRNPIVFYHEEFQNARLSHTELERLYYKVMESVHLVHDTVRDNNDFSAIFHTLYVYRSDSKLPERWLAFQD